ncbi:MAG TPA: GNAT family protein [Rhizomicrobium sp.]|nr:GNAT family protein [Rhizomicrobium sp.]
MTDLTRWTGAARPGRTVLDGRYARLEPLDAERHAEDLLASALEPGTEARFRYLFDPPPGDAGEMAAWMKKAAASDDPLFFAVIDRATSLAQGRQALMRIDPANGVIEVGSILWGPAIARTRIATEALYLFARHVFEDLGYRRFEWKCDSRNEPSRRAALRFGFSFEGIFRQHMVVKGRNRDTAWYATLDHEWPGLKARFESWLEPDNFDAGGQQKRRLNISP